MAALEERMDNMKLKPDTSAAVADESGSDDEGPDAAGNSAAGTDAAAEAKRAKNRKKRANKKKKGKLLGVWCAHPSWSPLLRNMIAP